jgi:hypothetical protein
MRKKHQEQMKIEWLTKRIEDKFETYVAIALEMAMKTECVQSVLWERIIDALASGKVDQPNAYVKKFYDTVWSPNWQLRNSINRMRPLEAQKFLRFSFKLRQAAMGATDSIVGIKKDVMMSYVNNMKK